MRFKGFAVSSTTVIIASSLISGMFLGLTLDYTSNLGPTARLETLPIIDTRVESAIYTAYGLQEGEIQLNFNDQYGIQSGEDGEKWINYSSRIGSQRRVLDPPVEFSVSETGTSSSLCITKSGENLELSPGDC